MAILGTMGASMPPILTHPFGGRGEMVTSAFITCHNLNNEISSLLRIFQQMGQANNHSRTLLILWHILGRALCTDFTITEHFVNYMMHSSFTYRQLNRNFTSGYSAVWAHPQPKFWKCWSQRCHVVTNVVCKACQLLDIYASVFITLTPLEYDALWETLLSVHFFHPSINLWSMLPFSAKKLDSYSLCWYWGIHHAMNCSRNEDINAKSLITQLTTGNTIRSIC